MRSILPGAACARETRWGSAAAAAGGEILSGIRPARDIERRSKCCGRADDTKMQQLKNRNEKHTRRQTRWRLLQGCANPQLKQLNNAHQTAYASRIKNVGRYSLRRSIDSGLGRDEYLCAIAGQTRPNRGRLTRREGIALNSPAPVANLYIDSTKLAAGKLRPWHMPRKLDARASFVHGAPISHRPHDDFRRPGPEIAPLNVDARRAARPASTAGDNVGAATLCAGPHRGVEGPGVRLSLGWPMRAEIIRDIR